MNRVINLNPSADALEAVRIKWPKVGRIVRLEVMRFIPHSGIAGSR
jgi:hypothetical protein